MPLHSARCAYPSLGLSDDTANQAARISSPEQEQELPILAGATIRTDPIDDQKEGTCGLRSIRQHRAYP